MIEELLSQSENKILEFKENTKTLHNIIKTIIAFANTSGGTLIIGVQDKTREVVGIINSLQEEERLANSISDNICPLLVPDIELLSYRNKELIVIRVPHAAGPYFLKSEGPERGVYVRSGSTNRKADDEMISALKLFAANLTYDELPQLNGTINVDLVQRTFGLVNKNPSDKALEMLGIFSSRSGKLCPTVGGVLLFDPNRLKHFPDSIIRCARFAGATKEKILDQLDIDAPLPFAIDDAIRFIERNTRLEGKIGRMIREDIPEYPQFAVREAVINSILHADYSMKGCHIQIAIFEDRIEFTNPGGLPIGQTMQKALAGFSRLRNRVLGRVFREVKLIEQWGSGLQRIFALCNRQGLKTPLVEDLDNQFRLVLFSTVIKKPLLRAWEEDIIKYLQEQKVISPKAAAKLWKISDRAARDRLKTMLEEGVIYRIATSEKDPKTVYVLKSQHQA
ncbi:MAG: putative DNA binding domain-containing protein [Chlamydiales bacterium]|nr:putative DNA binding domain-containing protein [Chlamydiales bacterium]